MPGTITDLSRLQFLVSAIYDVALLPLTLGLVILIAIIESVYVMTSRPVWRQMAQFWGMLFTAVFAVGVAANIAIKMNLGLNAASFVHYAGDAFGLPMALEALTGLGLALPLLALYHVGWQRLSHTAHLAVTWALAATVNLAAMWLMIGQAWLQNPVGAVFNPDSQRMELQSLAALIYNPVAQVKFVHLAAAAYTTAAAVILGTAAYYLLRNRHQGFAIRSFVVASSFGLFAAISTMLLGDASGYTSTDHQRMKIAAIAGAWQTRDAPAPLTLFALPDFETRTNRAVIEVPFAFGLLATRSVDQKVPGITELVERSRSRIRDGLIAYRALQTYRQDPKNSSARRELEIYGNALGYALLLKANREDVVTATPQQITTAAWSTVPDVPALFFSFRIMVLAGVILLTVFAAAFWASSTGRIAERRALLRLAAVAGPLAFLANASGWVVAEHGREPWAIDGVLPAAMGASRADPTAATIATFAMVGVLVVVLWVLVAWWRGVVRRGPGDALMPAPRDPLSPAQSLAAAE